jgi:hypothetical protein
LEQRDGLDEIRHRAGRCAGWSSGAGRPGATEPPQGVLPHWRIGRLLFCCHGSKKNWRSGAVQRKSSATLVYRRPEMSTLMKNKSLLLLPIGLAVLVVIGILTS